MIIDFLLLNLISFELSFNTSIIICFNLSKSIDKSYIYTYISILAIPDNNITSE